MKTTDLVRDSLLAALLLALQVGLAWLPNIELVTLLLILFAVWFGSHGWIILYVFVLLEGLIYGFGLWWLSYLYVWAVLMAAALFMRRFRPGPLSWALLGGIFGLLFGGLCSLSYLAAGGPSAAFAWWISGIPSDIIHGISNFILILVLFTPLSRLFSFLKRHGQ